MKAKYWIRFGLFILSLFTQLEDVWAAQKCEEEGIQSTTPSERFTVQGALVSDAQTNLIWQRCFVGVSGEDCSTGKPVLMNWASSLQYVEDFNKDGGVAGFRDWRIPNIRELQTIAELQCVEPSLSPRLFPSAPSGRTWSSSPYQFYPHYSWFVDFKFFEVTYQERYNPYFVLLVRGG